LKNSNLCDHNSPTSQTDGRTDRQTTCDRNTALCTKVHRAVITRSHCSVRQRVLQGQPSKSMGNDKIWNSADTKPLNRSSPNLKHVITSGISSSKKIWAQSAHRILPHRHHIIIQYPKYTPKTFECLLYFISVLPSPHRRAR